ncbi:unnamed protein product [Arctia plantaginis]|uniref:Uncharacterized protein n=1 Tax=Arctia plantaginis TaxID=874455 RepID=A0A8S0ZGJ8_ARCPL|nr:unnamed protein product [Arctia plantaginis]
MLVVSTLQRVNNSLKIILHEIRNEVSISNLESRSEPVSLLVKDGWTDNDNQMEIVNIIPRYVACVLDLVPTLGSRDTSGSEIPTTKCVFNFVFCLFSVMILATVVEPCHRTHEQLLVTRNLVDNLLRYTGPEAAAVRYELKLFKLHILLNPVSFNPCQLLTFNRTTLVAAVSTVIRNITVMMYL